MSHCTHCEVFFDRALVGQQVHKQILEEYPDHIKEDFERLSTWLYELAHEYGDAIRIRLIDPQSIEGFLKSIRYWVMHYPAFIISNRKVYVGWDKTALNRILQFHIVRNPH